MTRIVAALAAIAALLPASAWADVGFRDQHFVGNGTEVTGSKPESKLAFARGSWWAVMWDEVAAKNAIYQLDADTQTWQRTATVVDPRPSTRADVLFDGVHLYVASHQFSTIGQAGPEARLYRFGWSAGGWKLDAGFPVAINNAKTESLVIDRDSTGTLWATWVQDQAVYVNRTVGDDRTWGTPLQLPAAGATGLSTDDISSLVALGGNSIGVMWSNQAAAAMEFATHLDGAADGDWSEPEVVRAGTGQVDDHIDLKASADGRVFAAIKTDLAGPSDPLVVLAVRGAGGGWTNQTVGLKSDRLTRPVLVLDEQQRQVDVFATAPESGGTIYEKTASMDALAAGFAPGRGTPFIQDDLSADVNDATTTKQSVGAASGLVVLASNDTTGYYWHNAVGVPPPPLEADFDVDSPASGPAPLTVAFADGSTGRPTAWSWDFGDGATSTERNPSHRYVVPGTYSVSLTVTDAQGATSTRTRTALVSVGEPVPLAADFGATTATTGRAPLTVSFADASTGGPTGWSWDFGDGTASTEQSPSHTYDKPGTYTVSLTVANDVSAPSTRTRTDLVTVYPPLTADIGYRDQHFSGNGTQVTGAKTESKLWFHDGTWWAIMWDEAAGENRIERLDRATQTWRETSTVVDPRSGSRADVLSKGAKLYVASHVYSNNSSPGADARLYRYSYDPQTRSYTLDAGFPAVINDEATESLVIDRDSTGTLWATWVQDQAVYVNRTVGDDGTWGTPFVLPAADATNLDPDDVSSLVAFGGNRIGVMWSNQTTDTKLFTVHADGAAADAWGPAETLTIGPNTADDHVNLKASSDGRVFAVVKTDLLGLDDPLVVLWVRGQAGDWSRYTVGLKSDRLTRPIVLLDEANRKVHVFATALEAGGTIYHKTSSMDDISFAPGRGEPFIQDGTSQDMNDATSTKQNVTPDSGLVVLASNDSNRYYWHNAIGVTATPLQADFEPTSHVSGQTPLTVAFTDRSTSDAVAWSWDFGDGATSTQRNPGHTYTTPGTYTVRLTVTDAQGATSTRTATDLVTVLPPPPVASFTTTGPTTGLAPLTVGFQDTSSGSPTSWKWTFGDGGTSVERNPTHTYTQSGTYTVTLTATNASGSNTVTRTNLVTVTRRTTFNPVADAYVSKASSKANFGTATSLRVLRRDEERSYLRFTVSNLTGTVTAAKLRLWVTGSAGAGGALHLLPAGTWTETGITYANAPAIANTALATAGAVTAGTWLELTLPAGAITGNGTYTLALRNAANGGGNASAVYASREVATAANRPQLVVDTR